MLLIAPGTTVTDAEPLIIPLVAVTVPLPGIVLAVSTPEVLMEPMLVDQVIAAPETTLL
jgi:hypothetical protein